jgi:hypothetical protein
MQQLLAQVRQFHDKFGIPAAKAPSLLHDASVLAACAHLREEVKELEDALLDRDLEGVVDGATDVLYLGVGIFTKLGLDRLVPACWAEVHRSNMEKVKGPYGAKPHAHDIIKPEGWVGPRLGEVLRETLPELPKVITLCGSTRFKHAFEHWNRKLTLEGHSVFSVGVCSHAEGVTLEPEVKARLDEVHKRKIDLSDEIFVLDVGGYVGDSTRSEITHAETAGKVVRYLSEVCPEFWDESTHVLAGA